MFKTAWQQRAKGFKDAVRTAKTEIEKLDTEINGLLARLVDSSSDTVMHAFEKRIAEIETKKLILKDRFNMAQQQAKAAKSDQAFEDKFRTAFDFLLNPLNPWLKGDMATKQTVLKMAFAGPILYNRKEGVRTATPSLPFQVIQSLSNVDEDQLTAENSLVPPKGESSNTDFEELFQTLDDWEAILKSYRHEIEALGGDE